MVWKYGRWLVCHLVETKLFVDGLFVFVDVFVFVFVDVDFLWADSSQK